MSYKPDGPKLNRSYLTEGHEEKIKIFVGSWNVKFQEFSNYQFEKNNPGDKDSKITNSRSDNELQGQQPATVVPDGHIDVAKALYQARASSSFVNFKADFRDFSDSSSEDNEENSKLFQPFSDWINSEYDIIILAFQELIMDNILDGIHNFLNNQSHHTFKRLESPDMKISGYGEGALSSTKSTLIAVWARSDRIYPFGPIKFKQACKVSFGFLKGSKGAVSVSIDVFGQKICFIGCHLPASKEEDRRLACKIIVKKMAENYKRKNKKQLSEQFHHIIWAGDFNSRIYGIDLQKAIDHLSKHEINELLKFDELIQFKRYSIKDLDFRELPINFFPTYKKYDDRPLRDLDDPDWLKKHYIMHPQDKWYKAKKYREQIPSWTDRIIYWSREGYNSNMRPIDSSYKDASESCANSMKYFPIASYGIRLFNLFRSIIDE